MGRLKKVESMKRKTKWITRHQLTVLAQIARAGRAGIKLWHTDINLATIRSLCKRGLADTASKGRVIATRAGKKRLREPWPAESSAGDQKDRASVVASGAAEIAPVTAEGSSDAGEVDDGTYRG